MDLQNYSKYTLLKILMTYMGISDNKWIDINY